MRAIQNRSVNKSISGRLPARLSPCTCRTIRNIHTTQKIHKQICAPQTGITIKRERERKKEHPLKSPYLLFAYMCACIRQVFIKSELKVGVIYVKENQFTEEHILDNNENSPMFDEFLQLLGDKSRLRGFDKYKGGLDTVHDLTGMYRPM